MTSTDHQYWAEQSVNWNHQAISAANKVSGWKTYDFVACLLWRFNVMVWRILTKYYDARKVKA